MVLTYICDILYVASISCYLHHPTLLTASFSRWSPWSPTSTPSPWAARACATNAWKSSRWTSCCGALTGRRRSCARRGRSLGTPGSSTVELRHVFTSTSTSISYISYYIYICHKYSIYLSIVSDILSFISKSWNSRWLEVLSKENQRGFHPEIPAFGFGDPTSYRLIEEVVKATSISGAVRHGAECAAVELRKSRKTSRFGPEFFMGCSELLGFRSRFWHLISWAYSGLHTSGQLKALEPCFRYLMVSFSLALRVDQGFNFYFPQEFDSEYLVIWHGFSGKPWEYKDGQALQSFLLERIDEGFTFPLNPVWPVRDPGWYEVFAALRRREDLCEALHAWYPPHKTLGAVFSLLSPSSNTVV